MRERRIRTAYQIVTEESASQGDFAEQGWGDEDGVLFEENYGDPDDGAVPSAIRWLQSKGSLEPSCTVFHRGIWYSQADADIDMYSGEHRTESYHLSGFTVLEEHSIFRALTGKPSKTV